jgi:hypothetical protein
MALRIASGTPKQLGAIDRLMPWIVGNLFVLGLFGRDILNFNHGLVSTNAYWGRDFINVWASGKLVLAGYLDILYDLGAYHRYAQELFGPIGQHNYSYPPLVLPLMVPFALLPYPLALACWTGLTGWLFARAAAPWWRDATGLPAWAVLLTPAALVNIWAGHYGFLIGALLLFGWRNLERRPFLAGICFGLMVIKPHLAVLVPLVLLIRRDWTAIIAAAVTVAALVLGSLALFGPTLWYQYLTVTAGVQSAMIDAGNNFFRYMSTSTATAMLQLGMPKAVAGAIHALVALAAVVMVAVAARRAALRDVALLAATATFLVLPYAFNYDLTVSAMAAMMLFYRPDLSAIGSRVAIGGFAAAQVGMALAGQDVPGMTILLFALTVLQFRIAMARATGQVLRGTVAAAPEPAFPLANPVSALR